MEAQTLQQQTPIYHVCQECGGEGCAACSDLLILDGDIQLDPEWSDEHTVQEQLDWLDAFSERVQLLTAMAPINGVIGVNAAWKPAYEFIVVWKENGKSFNKCFTNEADSLAHFEALIGRASSVCMVYPDGQSLTELPAPNADPVCPKCGKSRFDSAYGCLAPQVYSPAAGDWVCGKKTAAPSPKPSPKYDISFDDRNMYQRREDELRLAGEWEV